MKSKKIFCAFLIFFSALLSILSHPTVVGSYRFPVLGFLAWFAYIPLLLLLEGKSARSQFKISFLFSLLFCSGAMYWLYTALNVFGHLPPFVSVLVLFVLIVILSLYFGIIFLITALLEKRFNISRFWLLPLVWVMIEWCRGHWPVGGFPWGQVGYSQAQYPLLIQIADLAGVYGVTAFIVWLNLAGVEIFKLLSNKFSFSYLTEPKEKNRQRIKFIFVITLIFFVLFYGYISKQKIFQKNENSPRIKIALLQGNIPQDEKWLSSKASLIVETYAAMTNQALSLGAELIIWPESAYPYEISLDEPEFPKLFHDFSKDLVLGAVTFEGKLPSNTFYAPAGFPIYNSALLINPTSNQVQAYHKQHLVPYGEYIPLKNILPFIKKMTAQVGEFNAGKEFNLLSSEKVKMGFLICYEDVFSGISRGHAKAGANLLVNLTNDAWYGNSSALPQHLNFSIFRAVENRRSLVRSTNTGMTAVIDPTGVVQKTLPPFTRDLLIEDVSLFSSPLTFYSRFGDVFAAICIGAVVSLILRALINSALIKKK